MGHEIELKMKLEWWQRTPDLAVPSTLCAEGGAFEGTCLSSINYLVLGIKSRALCVLSIYSIAELSL